MLTSYVDIDKDEMEYVDGGVIGWALGNFTAYTIGIQVGRALVTGKGLNITWDGISVK